MNRQNAHYVRVGDCWRQVNHESPAGPFFYVSANFEAVSVADPQDAPSRAIADPLRRA